MQSRRHEDYMSPSSKARDRHGKREMRHDLNMSSYRDAPDRPRRSLSPHKVDESRRVLDGHGGSGSTERRDYGWHLGGGRTERVRSKSPNYGQLHRRPHFDDEVMHRRYGYQEDVEFDHGMNSRSNHVYEYDHGSPRVGKDKNYSENRVVGNGDHGMLSQKSIQVEDGTTEGLYRLPHDIGPSKNYGEPGGSQQLPSRGKDIGRFEHEKYQEPIPSDNLAVRESYKEEEKPVYHSRDKLSVTESYVEGEKPTYHSREMYKTVPASHSKDILSTSQYKDVAGTSSRASMSDFPAFYRDGVTLPTSDGYQSSVKITEAIGYNTYEQRPFVDTARDTEDNPRNFNFYQHGAYSPSKAEHDAYIYPKARMVLTDDQGYPSDHHNSHKMMPPHTRLDYDRALMDYERRDLPRPNDMLSVVDRIDKSEHSSGNLRRSSVLDQPTLQKQSFSDYLDMSRKPYALTQGGEYLNPGYTHVDFERRVPRDYGMSDLGVPQDHQNSYLRSDYGFGRGAGQEIQNERLQSSSGPFYSSEMHEIPVRSQAYKAEELGMRGPSERIFKRKNMDNDTIRHNSRTIMSREWNVSEEFEDLYDSDEEYFDEDMSGVHLSKTGRFGHNEYRKGGRTYDGRERRGSFTSDDRFSTRDSMAHSQRSVRLHNHSNRYIKTNTRPDSLSWHNSHHIDRRGGLHKQHKVWKRIQDFHEDVHENDGNTSEDQLNLAELESSEESEEFKEVVHKFFLEYSKKLNVNSSVQRRYKALGKAGSLFCIACGRRFSKEFMNTQGLIRHTLMSRRVGLRARHLGLHKAICALLGWYSVVPHDPKTWVSECLPDAEAKIQKNDLVLWPPIIIVRNISMSNNNPKEQKVIPIEGVEAFLRGKGFVGGKITVCLGRPADQSVMVVKFLGTFTGLGNAERLHKYFAENKRGRAEFEQLTSNNSKSSSTSMEEGMLGDQAKERLLYGYMGISEDLDLVDFHTKNYCEVKSKQEIVDLDNAPVKPDER
ncbi:hypothetical protein LWI28_028111 [Acer negundo]|uniref:XS domain-containing protein n=1 Tax=Acer negundo TaxID=4023 RepID=A0AAD5NIA1_ACENE|nr:hypothetical protein LWI28_028111 [Acer negundo]KAK4835744.1 hypothetical protein QYF36_013915 [Acer negundo]